MMKINNSTSGLVAKYVPFIFCTVILTGVTIGQTANPSSLEQKLESKSTFQEVMQVVEDHYRGHPDDWRGPDGNDPKIKHWYRWADYMSSRLNADGSFVNIPKMNDRAYRQMQKMTKTSDRSINGFWDFVGPNDATGGTGRVDRIAFHPTIPGIIYVGTPAGGVWYSDNTGNLWLPISDHIPSTGISGIVVSHTTPSDVYILTGDGDSDFGSLVRNHGYMRPSVGVIKSANGGNTWYATGEMSPDPFTGYKLIQDPNDENILIAATSIGIFRTTDGCNTWTQVATGRYFDVEYRPGSSDTVYAADNQFVYMSVDSGQIFNNVSNFDVPISSSVRLELAIAPSSPDIMYLLAGGVIQEGQFSGFYRSTDAGFNFTQRVDTPNIIGYGQGTGAAHQALYDLCMDVDPNDPNTVYTGGIYVWKTTDGGQTFDFWQNNGHADVHDVKVNPLNGFVYMATDGGVYRSADAGSSWDEVFVGMGTTQIYNMGVDPADPSRLVIGNQDCGIQFKNGFTDDFDLLVGGDGYDGTFAAGRDTIYATRNSLLYMYTNDGADNETIFTPDSAWFGNIIAHNTDPDMVFLGKGSVWRSDDAGTTWDSLGASGFWDITTCPSNSNRIYTTGGTSSTGGSVGFWRSDNLGDTWFDAHDNATFPNLDSISKITEIGVRPNNSLNVWFTVGGFTATHKVFYSPDGGGTWSNMTDNLPNVPVNSIAITANNDAYIGTDIGVFYRRSGMNLWMPWSNNLPNTPVTELYIAGNKIIAATFGRGIWDSPVSEECYNGMIISGSFEGQFHYEADSSIHSTAEIYHGIGTKVVHKAGTVIRLQPGFHARRLAIFRAVLGPCGEGGIVED